MTNGERDYKESRSLEASFRYQLGSLLVDSSRSPLAMANLPLALARLIGFYRRRNRSMALVGELECGQGLGDLEAAAIARPLDPSHARALRRALRDTGRPVPEVSGLVGWAGTARDLIEEYKSLISQGPAIPERAGTPAFTPRKNTALVVLHSSLIEKVNGYAMRGHHLLSGLVDLGWSVSAGVRNLSEGEHRRDAVDYIGLEVASGVTSLEALIEDYASRIEALAHNRRPSLIHAASNFITGHAGLRAARRLGLPFIYEVRGLWHVTRASHTLAFADTLSYRLQAELELDVIREADRAVMLNDSLRRHFASLGIEEGRMSVVENGADPARFLVFETETAALRRRFDLDGRRIIGFCGSLTSYEGLDLLVEAVKPVLRAHKDVLLVFVGDGPARPGLEARLRQAGLLDRARFCGLLSPEDARAMTALFDIAPFPRPSNPVNRLVTPLKPLEAMAAGAAILVSDVPPLVELLAPGMGEALPAGVVAAWRRELIMLLNDPKELSSRKKNAKENAGKRLWIGMARELEKEYQNILA